MGFPGVDLLGGHHVGKVVWRRAPPGATTR
jgi:hypothetical protein